MTYLLLSFEVAMLLIILLKSFKDSVLVPSSIKMHVFGPHKKKLVHAGWQLQPGKVPEGFR